MVRLILFDIDGTLLHTGGAGRKAFSSAFATAFGIPNGTNGIDFSGRTDTSLVRELFRIHDVSHTPQNVEKFFGAYYFWLDHILDQSRGTTCPYVWEFLSAVRSLPSAPAMGLLTGNVRLGAEIKLRHFRLWQEFVTGAFGDDHEERGQVAVVAKNRATQLLGGDLHGEEIVVVGDTPLDVACARAISARCLAVGTGGISIAELERHNPTWVVSDLSQILPEVMCSPRH